MSPAWACRRRGEKDDFASEDSPAHINSISDRELMTGNRLSLHQPYDSAVAGCLPPSFALTNTAPLAVSYA